MILTNDEDVKPKPNFLFTSYIKIMANLLCFCYDVMLLQIVLLTNAICTLLSNYLRNFSKKKTWIKERLLMISKMKFIFYNFLALCPYYAIVRFLCKNAHISKIFWFFYRILMWNKRWRVGYLLSKLYLMILKWLPVT